jgi:uncharacterized protein (TIGR02001 family)
MNWARFFIAILDRGAGGSCVVRLLPVLVASSIGMAIGTARCAAADVWGGSLGLTSDYMVRGISRSNDQAALQLDLHYLNTSGFVAGLFMSNAQIDPGEARDVELDGFVGFAWNAGTRWHGKILASHYAYPWNQAGTRYDYDEVDIDVAYQDWLDVAVMYSPDAPRYYRYQGLRGVDAKSAEVNLQQPVFRKLSATAGVGYYFLSGPRSTGYGYWSVGAAYDLAPWALTLSYVNATAEAGRLFYNSAAGGRWTGTVIWRF